MRSKVAIVAIAHGLLVAVAFSSLTCADQKPPPPASGPRAARCSAAEAVICEGNVETRCAQGRAQSVRTCPSAAPECVDQRGCIACVPSSIACRGDAVLRCRADGSGTDVIDTCDSAAGFRCSPTLCQKLCEVAENSRSYIGCEYYAASTSNASLDPGFAFSVVVSNPQLVDARVTLEGNGISQTATVAPKAVHTFLLPYVALLKGPSEPSPVFQSRIVPASAYVVRSDVPIVAYQYNPLEFNRCRAGDAGVSSTDRECYSYTADASLLLPRHVLGRSYIVMSRPTMRTDVTDRGAFRTLRSPGFVAIVGVDDEVTVQVVPKAHVEAEGAGAFPDTPPGQPISFTLRRGDVAQLVSSTDTPCATESVDAIPSGSIRYCLAPREYDLTGTEITSSGRIEVISGHDCTFVPYNKWACDHLEEALFPLDTWGKEANVVVTKPTNNEPNVIRIVSGANDNQLTFTPLALGPRGTTVANVTLSRGEFVEFEAAASFQVTGTQAISVAQFLVGQDYGGLGTGSSESGDPSMALIIPREQYRSEYAFLAAPTYSRSFVQLVAPRGASVTLDGRQVGGFVAIGDASGFETVQLPVPAGAHVLAADRPFGATLHGLAPYTSYTVPAGLDFRQINAPF